MITALLTPKERADIGQLLRNRRDMLAKSIADALHTEDATEVRATQAGESDWTTADIEADAALSRLERDTRELEAVDDALKRFADTDFGECGRCGAPIGYPRLLAHPTATHCLSCQTKLEANQVKIRF